ncbi:MAG: alpha/beta hydrolase [Rhodospirillales bacterium]
MPDSRTLQKAAILSRGDRPAIAYQRTKGRAPGVMFLGGYRSDMTGAKALALEGFCQARKQAFLRFDYSGHGASGGTFTDCTISTWLDDSLDALDKLTEGPQILVGSSMGGWLTLLVALRRPDRVAGLVGIASAPDFTEELLWPNMAPPARRELAKNGVIYRPSAYGDGPYPITKALIEDGRNHLLLGAPIPVKCPVRLLHGMQDRDVPWIYSQRLAERLESENVTVTLFKSGGHRLAEPEELARLNYLIGELSALAGK